MLNFTRKIQLPLLKRKKSFRGANEITLKDQEVLLIVMCKKVIIKTTTCSQIKKKKKEREQIECISPLHFLCHLIFSITLMNLYLLTYLPRFWLGCQNLKHTFHFK